MQNAVARRAFRSARMRTIRARCCPSHTLKRGHQAASSVFQLIPAYSSTFRAFRTQLPAYSRVFQPIPAYSSLFPDKKIFLMNGEVTIQSARREEPPLLHVGEGIYRRNTGVSDRRWFYVDLCGLPGRKTCISNHVNPLKTT